MGDSLTDELSGPDTFPRLRSIVLIWIVLCSLMYIYYLSLRFPNLGGCGGILWRGEYYFFDRVH